MKKILLGTVALAALGLVAPAVAADIPAKAPMYSKAPAMVALYNWTGFYVGADVGYKWGSANVDIPAYPSNFNMTTGGIVGGLHAGYNFQMGGAVIGVDANIFAAGVTGDALIPGSPVVGERYRIREDWQGSIAGRLGFASNNWMVFGRAGWAIAGIRTDYIPLVGGVQRATINGWTAGAGVEYAFNTNWTARLEYRYSDYGRVGFVHAGASSVDYNTHEALVGVSYKFGGPVVAKY